MSIVAIPGYVLDGAEWKWAELGSGADGREFELMRRDHGGEHVMIVVMSRARMHVAEHSQAYPLTSHAARDTLLSWFLVNRTEPESQVREARRLNAESGLWQRIDILLEGRDVEGERIEYAGWWLVAVITPVVIIGVAGPCDEMLETLSLRSV